MSNSRKIDSPAKKAWRTRRRKKSMKGMLIKGMSRRLPAQILEDPAFRAALTKIMKNYSGIYALYKHNKLYYIGLTKNLHGRLNSHYKDKYPGRWDKFVIFRIKRVDYLKDIETLLLQVALPPGNSVTGHVPRDGDLNRVLKKIHREQEVKLRQLKKAFR